jgi:hypothetical protein
MKDNQVFARVDRSAVKEIIAPGLSSFIVSTARCLHMGSRIMSDRNRPALDGDLHPAAAQRAVMRL